MPGLSVLCKVTSSLLLQGTGKKGKGREAYIFDLKSDRFAKELEAAVNVSISSLAHCSIPADASSSKTVFSCPGLC